MLDQAPADIIGMGITPQLVQSVSCADQQTAELAMRLLHNLSFHEKGCKAMVSAGAISKVKLCCSSQSCLTLPKAPASSRHFFTKFFKPGDHWSWHS